MDRATYEVKGQWLEAAFDDHEYHLITKPRRICICRKKMYPRVKVSEQEEDDQYAYEKGSLQSLKGFEWLSLHDSSSPDESPQSPVRIPGSYVPKSAKYNFRTSKEETDNKKTVLGENRINLTASSIPRPRAVLSSPDNDGIDRSKTKTRRELLSGLKNHNLCQNRHTQCKVIPRSSDAESFTSSLLNNKEAVERNNDYRAKGRAVQADSSPSAGPPKRKTDIYPKECF
ncbi:Uncharacterized protein Adt_22141 [Abeliophyllum distichum]|uniref:Uncharacterized protein n=1 Tax=Abeliophyllum distichum TaxID=126358 RepID=A0ABD1T1C1_9LAMI